MRFGQLIRRNVVNHNLDGDVWIEVFPDGKQWRELWAMRALRFLDKRGDLRCTVGDDQSPVLVRHRVALEELAKFIKKPTITDVKSTES